MMNTVPLLFAEAVARLLDEESLYSLKAFSSGIFGKVGRSLWENRLRIDVNVVFNRKTGKFDYCLTCKRNDSVLEEVYTYDPADRRFVLEFQVHLLQRTYVGVSVTWTTAAPSDPTLLWWLRVPFARSSLYLYANCPQFLNLLPDYCTFYSIYAFDDSYNEVLDTIIHRSQECGRLEKVNCTEFFRKRGREASMEWISTNKRLGWIAGCRVDSPAAIERALDAIGVPGPNRPGAQSALPH